MLAWENNADAVEVDVHLSKDNKIVVMHDDSTERTSGVTLDIRKTVSSQLRQLDVGAFKAKCFKGEKVPFLDEILELLPPDKKLFAEIKCGQDILPYLQEAIARSRKGHQITLMSFNLETIAMVKDSMPQVVAYWLIGTMADGHTGQILPHDKQLADTAKENNLDGMAVKWDGVTTGFLTYAKATGLDVYAWTVDDPKVAFELQRLRIDGVITNRPGWLRKALKRG